MGQYLRKMERFLEREPFSDLLPVREYWDDEKLFICDDNSIAAFFVCQPSPGGSTEIRTSFEQLFKLGMKQGVCIQAQLASLPDIESSLHGYRQLRGLRAEGSDAEMLDAYARSTHDFYANSTRKPVNDRGFLFRDLEFWFTVKMPIKDALPSDKEIKKFQTFMKDVISQLSAFSPYRANETMWWRRMHVLHNMFDGDYIGKPIHKQSILMDRELRERILEDGKRTEVEEDGIQIYTPDGKPTQHIKTMTINKLPDTFAYGIMADVIGDWRTGRFNITQHFLLTCNVVIPDQLAEAKSIRSKRNFVTTQARGSVIKYLEKLRYQKQDLDDVLTEIDQDGATLAHYALQMAVFAPDRNKAEESAKALIGKLKNKNIKAHIDSHMTLPNFLSQLPMGLTDIYRKHSRKFALATSRVIPFVIPHFGGWKGNTINPVFQLTNRYGQVVSIDFFEADSNYNVAVAAESGGGKSFLTGYIINSYLGAGVKKQPEPDDPALLKAFHDAGQVFIMDVGYSYKGLAHQYKDSQYLEVDNSFKYSLNPFPMVQQMGGVEGQASMIAAIIKVMAAPNGQVTNYQNSEILRLLDLLWNTKGRDSTITDFQNLCLEHDHEEIVMLGRQLSAYCEGGVYEDLFSNKKPPVNYDSRLVVVELEKIADNKHLQLCAMMCTIMSIQKKMFLSGTKFRSIFVLEEAWEWLSERNTTGMFTFFAEFLEAGWRRFRKAGAMGICVTQNANDYNASALGRAIKDNSAWDIFLKQKQTSIDQLKEDGAYSGSDIEFDLLKSLRKVNSSEASDEAFSEMLIKHTSGSVEVCRLYADRNMQLILTTDPDEKERRQELLDQGYSFNEAINIMIEEEQQFRRRFAS